MFTFNNFIQYHRTAGTFTTMDDMRERYITYISNRGYVLYYGDGDPSNLSADNLVAVPNMPDGPHPPSYGGPPRYRKSKKGTSMSINIAPLNSVIVKVFFTGALPGGQTLYSYLADKSFDKDKTPFVIVPSQGILDMVGADDDNNDEDTKKRRKSLLNTMSNTAFMIGKVAKVVDPLEDTYEGEYKWIVSGFDPFEYLELLAVQKKRDALNRRLKKMAEEAQSRRSLKEIFGDNMPEEAKAMFAELEALEAAIQRNGPASIEGKVENPSDAPNTKTTT